MIGAGPTRAELDEAARSARARANRPTLEQPSRASSAVGGLLVFLSSLAAFGLLLAVLVLTGVIR